MTTKLVLDSTVGVTNLLDPLFQVLDATVKITTVKLEFQVTNGTSDHAELVNVPLNTKSNVLIFHVLKNQLVQIVTVNKFNQNMLDELKTNAAISGNVQKNVVTTNVNQNNVQTCQPMSTKFWKPVAQTTTL